MPNILDYIDWRGDLTFEKDPFNEVDGLILAQLSYIIFDNVLHEDFDHPITVRKASALYDPDKVDEKLKFYSFEKDNLLLPAMASSKRFGNILLTGYADKTDLKEALQFCAVTCIFPDGRKFISFRGTDGSIAGWREDFNLSYMTGSPSQLLAAEYLDKNFTAEDRLILGGHSKGANLAIYASVFCREELVKCIEKIYDYDGPGFRKDVTQTRRYKKIMNKITAIVPQTSMVGQLLDTFVTNKIVNSDENGIFQHFSYSWQVKRTRFDYADQYSRTGRYLNKVMDTWLAELDDETRKIVTDSLFDVIQASQKETLTEIENNKFSSYTAILKAITKLSPERQKVVRRAISLLFASGRETLKENIESAAQNVKFQPSQFLPLKKN
ncbi:MAG: DUF2974 domain-containing protein [Firmicutes bacterium]|nr:DUF2974 domain-containing protein [Bacillota bacterium]